MSVPIPSPDATSCAVGPELISCRSPATLEDIPDDVMTHIIGASLSHADFVCALNAVLSAFGPSAAVAWTQATQARDLRCLPAPVPHFD